LFFCVYLFKKMREGVYFVFLRHPFAVGVGVGGGGGGGGGAQTLRVEEKYLPLPGIERKMKGKKKGRK